MLRGLAEGRIRRWRALAIGVAVTGVIVGLSDVADAAKGPTSPSSIASVCSSVGKVAAAQPAPTNLKDAADGFTLIWDSTQKAERKLKALEKGKFPSKPDLVALRKSVAALASSYLGLTLLNVDSSQRVHRDDATTSLNDTQGGFTQLDAAALKLGLPACQSQSWGRQYVAQAQPVVQANFAQYFVSDVNDVCTSFKAALALAPSSSDQVSLLLRLQTTRDAFNKAADQLSAITPPAALAATYQTFIGNLRGEAQILDQAAQSGQTTPEGSSQLQAIATMVGGEVAALGVNCAS